jgi:hypothetical protein
MDPDAERARAVLAATSPASGKASATTRATDQIRAWLSA